MKSEREVIIVGASGHARVVIGALRAAGWRIRAAFDDDPKKWNQQVLGVPIVGPVELLAQQDGTPAVIAVGDPGVRKRVANQYQREWVRVIHPWTFVDPTASVGPGSVVFAGAVIQPEVSVGAHAIVNTSASLDHECVVGDYAHISPGVHLAGNVCVREGAFVGTGASVIRGVTIGEYSIVGAGAAVIRDIPERVTAVGCPARIIKRHAAPS